MVKIIDGYKERVERMKRYEDLWNLANQIFNDRCITKGDLEYGPITIPRKGDGSGNPVEIFPQTNLVVVNEESDLEVALKLAQEAEKITNTEFKLRKDYKPKSHSSQSSS